MNDQPDKPAVIEVHVDGSPIFFEIVNPELTDTPVESPTWAEILQATIGKQA